MECHGVYRVKFTAAIAISAAMLAGSAQAQNAPAAPASADSAADRLQATSCLALAIGYEAGNEPLAGQQAIAEVILNRVHHAGFPKTVCGVVFQGSERSTGCQFTFTCDGSIARHAFAPERFATWRAVAQSVLDGIVPAQVSGATHYHADYVSPYWAPSLVRVTQLGRHIFYRQPYGADVALAPGAIGGAVPVGVVLPAESAIAPVRAAPGAPRRPAPPPVFAPWGLLPKGS